MAQGLKEKEELTAHLGENELCSKQKMNFTS